MRTKAPLNNTRNHFFLIFTSPSVDFKDRDPQLVSLINSHQDCQFIYVDADKDFEGGELKLSDPDVKEKYALLLKKDSNAPCNDKITLVGHGVRGHATLASNPYLVHSSHTFLSKIGFEIEREFTVEQIASIINASSASKVSLLSCEAGKKVRGVSLTKKLSEKIDPTKSISSSTALIRIDEISGKRIYYSGFIAKSAALLYGILTAIPIVGRMLAPFLERFDTSIQAKSNSHKIKTPAMHDVSNALIKRSLPKCNQTQTKVAPLSVTHTAKATPQTKEIELDTPLNSQQKSSLQSRKNGPRT